MNSTTEKLPQRLRESSFRRYEDIIAKAVSCFPKPLVVDPKGSPVTFSYRLRDAMLSLYRHRWTTKVNMDKFETLYSEDRRQRKIHVSHVGEKVSIGGDIDHEVQESMDFTYVEQAGSDETIVVKDLESIKLLGALASMRLLNRPVRVSGISLDEAEWLEDNYDISITLNEDQTHTVI